ncbi:MAG: 4-hydroxy-tetrahydrodipicolinate synthase [Xanthobacteraceae bacterium]
MISSIGVSVAHLSGYAPALPTPFDENDRLDLPAFDRMCRLQIEAGATALVVGGTTGEASTLSHGEHAEIVAVAADAADGRVPVIAGTGSNSTAKAIELTQDAEAAGADAALCVVPYYNKPTQAGMYAHFCAIAQSTGLPIILYDVPSRTVCGLADETIARLVAEMPQFIGLKDASADLSRPQRLHACLRPGFRLLSGDDATASQFLALGGDGSISVTANVVPGLCRELYLSAKGGEFARAQHLSAAIAPLTAALLRESNPAPLKYALSRLGLMSPRVRLPLVEPTAQTTREIDVLLAELAERHADGLVVNWRACQKHRILAKAS